MNPDFKKYEHFIEKLLIKYPYNDLRDYKKIPQKKQADFLLNELQHLIEDENIKSFLIAENNEISGLSFLSHCKWDSAHFEIKIGEIPYLITNKEPKQKNRQDLRYNLLANILSAAKLNNYNLLWTKVDINDRDLLFNLQKIGFKYITTLVTFIHDAKNRTYSYLKSLYKVRDFQQNDLLALKKLAKNIVPISRFTYDPFFQKSKIEKLYEKWIENSFGGALADNILVAVNRKSEPIGFITYKFFEDIKKYTGVKIIGRGLLSVSKTAKGAGLSLVKALCGITSKYYDYAEYDSIINNFEAINIWRRFNLKLQKAKHILHLWIK